MKPPAKVRMDTIGTAVGREHGEESIKPALIYKPIVDRLWYKTAPLLIGTYTRGARLNERFR